MPTLRTETGLTVVAQHRVKAGREAEFETALRAFMTFALSFPGQQGINVLRPASGLHDYTMVARFADAESRQAFVATPDYVQHRAKLDALSEDRPRIAELTGMETWFTLPELPHAAPPPKVKMALMSFLGVYPTTLLLGALLSPLIGGLPRLASHAVMIACSAVALTWLVMPALARLCRRWLYPEHP